LRVCAFLIALLALSACERPQVYDTQFLAFGTLVEVTVYGADRQLAEHAFDAARADFQFLHRSWRAWKPSAVTRANAAIAAGRSIELAPVLEPLIEPAQRLSRLSGELFNPAIGKLIELWGFHSDDYAGRRPPVNARIDALVSQHSSMRDLVLEDGRLSSSNRSVQLDFGAFAKGVGVGRVVEHLRRIGVDNLIVNAGGDLRAIGAHGERPWRIGIRNPLAEGVLASVEINADESVFTSGNYERYFEFRGRRYHHIIDPRTGYPARGATSVTVIHADPGTADAAATALFVAGPRHWHSVAHAMGLGQVMLIDTQGRAHMTAAMAERTRFEVDPPPPIIVNKGS
jgi:thiamine biosynthesis lipoprotein